MISRLAITVLLLACASCSTAVAGTPAPDAGAVRALAEPLTAQEALGDFPTLNYCSLVGKDDFPADLGNVVVYPSPHFDACSFTVRTKYGDIRVRVGFIGDSDTLRGVRRTPDPHQTPPRGLEVQRGLETKVSCHRYLLFPDALALEVFADSFSTDAELSGDWCPIADAAMNLVIPKVIAKKVSHFTFQDGSLGKIDACDLLPEDLVAAKLTQPDTKELKFPSRHLCRWAARDRSGAEVTVQLTPSQSSVDFDTAKHETMAGHVTYLTPESDGANSYCDALTYLMNSPVLGEQEKAVVEVVLPGKGKDACGVAGALAEQAWRKLP